MTERPYVLLSVAASVDGYIDDVTEHRLLLSNDADFERVDEVRAGVDAILVGANTIRRDNPRLLVRSADRRRDRMARGLPGSPVKVTITANADLDPVARFFTSGETGQPGKIVYVPGSALDKARACFDEVATVVSGGDPLDLEVVLADLASRGVRRLMVEGGGSIHTQLLTAGLADEIHLVIAPFFVGDPTAPRFVGHGVFPQNPRNRMELAEVRRIGDLVLLRYLLRSAAGDVAG